VAAKYLARPDSSTVGIIACGVQGRTNLEALNCLFKIKKVKAYDLYPGIAETYAREMGTSLGLEIEPVPTPREAVKDLDIVVTSGPIFKSPTPLIEPRWLKPGGFASPVDFDSYWKTEALREIDRFATDDLVQMRYYRQEGYFKGTPEPYADLGEIVSGRKPGRVSPEERTLSMNLGLALDDMATAIRIYHLARERGIGTQLPL
jgi:ornithine cyclodeaminase/alanine dehydrogenase-like protein (mu-crystallin family)